MKILIISQYYYPEQFQINEIAPELVRRGHEVTVVCGLPNYPKGEIFEGYERKMKTVEPIIETNKIIIDGKEYDGKIIANSFSNYVRLKTKEETLIIVEPKSITIKN